ncbi:MAG: hypothetical protein OXC26_01165 [Albidovulum sp.]|nr:hypothetical protein [Albidovulum sp.]
MRSARIGWATCLLLGGVAVSLSGCLTKTKVVDRVVTARETVTAPNIAQMLLAESDYGTSDSKIKAAVNAEGMFVFSEITSDNSDDCGPPGSTPSAGANCIQYDIKSIFASQGTARTANVDFGNNVNSLQFIEVDDITAVKDADTDEGIQGYTEVTHQEIVKDTIPFSKLTGDPKDFMDSKSSTDDYGRKGNRYTVLHNLPDGNAIALFATESKYLKDYGSDDEDAEMFAGGYWVEISKDTDGNNNVVNAGVFSDAEGLTRAFSHGRWAFLWADDDNFREPNAAPYDDEITATYSGKTEGGYSDKRGAGGFSGDIELKAKLFGGYATASSGIDTRNSDDYVPAIAGTVSGHIDGIKLYTFQDFGNRSSNTLSGTVNLGSAPVGEMGTMKGDVTIGTVTTMKGMWHGIFSDTTKTLNAPTFVLGTYGFEHTQDSVERAFLGHFGLEHPDVTTD